MTFTLKFTPQAEADLQSLEADKSLLTIGSKQRSCVNHSAHAALPLRAHKRLKAVRKALGYLETNPRHPSLNTHKYSALTRPNGEEIFEAYAENKTPPAHRIFWFYGPDKKEITIIAITPHP